MLKKFFVSMFGSLVAILLAGGIVLMGFFMLVGIAVSGEQPPAVSDHTVIYLDLSGGLVDRQQKSDVYYQLTEETPELGVNSVINALRAAATDPKVDGIYIEAGGIPSGMATSQAVAEAIDRFKESGKWVLAYGDSYTQGDYFISCRADSVFVNPMGTVDIHGLGAQVTFFKGLLDKLGVDVQVVKVGTYKSAVEPFILTEISQPAREQMEVYLSQLWDVMRTDIAEKRGLGASTINSYADSVMFALDSKDLIRMKLVDGLRYRHNVESTLTAMTHKDDFTDINFITPHDYCVARSLGKPRKTKARVAVLYAMGDIVDSGKEGIVGDKYVDQILEIADDEDIDALVLRVNSPGGSVFASEVIWEALQEYKKRTGNPFYVSMGDYAASGGYYISCGADKIYAQPLTITGSIGIFGLIPNIQGTLSEHLGVNVSTVQTNANSTFPTILQPMTPQQAAAMQANVNRGYELFTSRVAQGRGLPQDSVKAIGEGRVWDGRTALALGLVDKLGGMDTVLGDMAEKLGVDRDEMAVVAYPDIQSSLLDELLSANFFGIRSWLSTDEISPATRKLYSEIDKIKNMSTIQARMMPVEIQ